jgi:hypothetical protein
MDIAILGYKLNVELLILIGVIYLILVGHTVCGCCNVHGIMEGLQNMAKKTKEGFSGANTNYGLSAPYSLANDKIVNTSSWFDKNLTITPGQPLSKGVKEILSRPYQPVPLPKGQLSMFANTQFKPECCPNTYSASMGCACMTVDQYNYLINRGGNNVPFSEY